MLAQFWRPRNTLLGVIPSEKVTTNRLRSFVASMHTSEHHKSFAEAILHSEHPEETTGEINQGRREFVLYYSNMFLPKGRYNRFLPRFLYRKSNDALEKQILDSLPEGIVKMLEFVPREYEGGIFVKYGIEDPNVSAKSCVRELIMHGRNIDKRYFKLWDRNVFLVRGTPWIEDLKRTFTSELMVTFDGPDLTSQQIYAEMRRYGRIFDIVPPAPGTKDLPRSSKVTFDNFFHAATARNCVNGLKVGETTIHISFIQLEWRNPLTKWIADHPRISIPILIAVIAGLAFYIFEPIRVLSITSKARGYFDFGKYGLIKWFITVYHDLVSKVYSLFSSPSLSTSPSTPLHTTETVVSWNQVYDIKNKIMESLEEGAETFNVILGPRGSGKSHVVNLVISDLGKTPIIQLDCEELLKAKTDTYQLDSLARQLGYRPAFLWTSSFTRFIDLAATSLAGQSSGFAETSAQQAKRMLDTAYNAIQFMALRKKPSNGLETDYLTCHPEQRPVVIIKNYRGAEDQEFYKMISQWAANMISNSAARVIVMTQDASFEKTLGEVLPDSVLRVSVMTDANSRVAKQYIIQSLENSQKLMLDNPAEPTPDVERTRAQLSGSLDQIRKYPERLFEPLGGRLSDLQNYSRRVLAGESPIGALETMVNATELEVEQMYLNSKSGKWSCEQAWVLIRKLAQLPNPNEWLSVPSELATDPIFKCSDGDAALRQLEYRELLVLNTSGGEIISARPGKPLYHAAFCQLAKNPYTCNIMDTRVLSERIKNEHNLVIKLEDELMKLALMPNGWATQRQRYLSNKLYNSQVKIEAWEKEAGKLLAELKKIKH